MTISVSVYRTHNNVFGLEVLQKLPGATVATPVDLDAAGVTRVVLDSRVNQIDSAESPAAFDFVTQGAVGIITFNFGQLPINVGKSSFTLIIYDVLHPNGQVWDDVVEIDVEPTGVT